MLKSPPNPGFNTHRYIGIRERSKRKAPNSGKMGIVPYCCPDPAARPGMGLWKGRKSKEPPNARSWGVFSIRKRDSLNPHRSLRPLEGRNSGSKRNREAFGGSRHSQVAAAPFGMREKGRNEGGGGNWGVKEEELGAGGEQAVRNAGMPRAAAFPSSGKGDLWILAALNPTSSTERIPAFPLKTSSLGSLFSFPGFPFPVSAPKSRRMGKLPNNAKETPGKRRFSAHSRVGSAMLYPPQIPFSWVFQSGSYGYRMGEAELGALNGKIRKSIGKTTGKTGKGPAPERE